MAEVGGDGEDAEDADGEDDGLDEEVGNIRDVMRENSAY